MLLQDEHKQVQRAVGDLIIWWFEHDYWNHDDYHNAYHQTAGDDHHDDTHDHASYHDNYSNHDDHWWEPGVRVQAEGEREGVAEMIKIYFWS